MEWAKKTGRIQGSEQKELIEFARKVLAAAVSQLFLLFLIYLLLVERKQLAVKFYDERYELRVWLYHN